eukprot:TRINITY_DN125888_c0_g1_i1.p1 TRINITY_DN125888_c0_g1~~TRINITY_DN125888_c0_g1_i1.p1  ORF type:complete len:210 (-),score=53.65 TRINITY_DN125888_c0_g1_i1:277-906(-)
MHRRAGMRRPQVAGVCGALAFIAAATSVATRSLAWLQAGSGSQGVGNRCRPCGLGLGRRQQGRSLRLRAGIDSGEFDFGEFDAPAGVRVEDAAEVTEFKLAPPEAEVFMKRETGEQQCNNCGYIYNPFWGAGDIPPGTKWDDVPLNFRCPECKVSKDQFLPVVEEIAGFAENQDFGVGFNSWTGRDKGIIIWGGLAIGAIGLLSGYLLD